ncbi:unnamed protein product [Brachionus calyciflorus]|uniref:SET domain-containing protein n=1 Tax=Brachionus calyciflorus TaxID=104777 RepID=A0A813NT41_9BILA|nr:unnamed protein product [Brachionus calyciflorus]
MEKIEIPEWQTFLECKLEILYKSPNLLEAFKNLKTNYERVEFVENNLFFSKLVERHLNQLNMDTIIDERKSLDLSETYRKKGNEYYSKKDNQNAFKFYTLSLTYAPQDLGLNKSLYLAYSNRSAVFHDLAMYQNCLNDLNTVKTILNQIQTDKINQKELLDLSNLILKLLNREINCVIKLNQVDNLIKISESDFFKFLKSEIFNTINDTDSKLSNILKITDEIVKNLKQNLNDPICLEENNFQNFISDSVGIEFTDRKGRHCLAKRKIKTGEVLFQEKAYCSILLPDASAKFCDICLKSLYDYQNDSFLYLNIQPCSECTSILYCSENCKSQSQDSQEENDKFHRYECKILKKLLHNLGIGHLAYRILNSTSQKLIDKFSKIQKLGDYESNLMNLNYRIDNYEDNYKQVFYLLTHESSTHVDDLFKYALTSLLLGKHYCMVRNDTSNEYLKLISSLILRHLLQSICNAHAITELKDDSKESKQSFNRNQLRYATAIYPRVSLLNHSCNSNVISTFKENSSVIVVKASRDIENKNEIYNSYGPHYIKMTYSERKESLMEQYHFICDCLECLDQASIFFKSTKTGLRCLECKTDQIWSNNEGKKAELIQIKCKKCKKDLDFGTYVYKFNDLDSFLSEFDAEILDEQSNKSMIVKLEHMIMDYGKYLMINKNLEVDPKLEINGNMRILYLDFSKLIDLLARLYCNAKNMTSCCSLLEKNIKLLDFIYETKANAVNVEIGHELFKLAELQCTIYNFNKAIKNIDRAISIGECVYSKQSAVLKEYYELRKNIQTLLNMD